MASPLPDSMAEDSPLSDYKLCGFLQAVLSVASPRPPTLGIPFSLFSEGGITGFRSDDGTSLVPVQYVNANGEPVDSVVSTADPDGDGGKLGKPFLWKRRRGRVLVNGSMSVVHQLHALVSHNCLKIRARVVRVSMREFKGMRAVVLVDVYLPIEVWSGWQFPRSRALAVSLFKHLSCNWEMRSSLLAFDQDSGSHQVGDDCVWVCSDCHVLGCKMHYISSETVDERLFGLHEIFKSLPSIKKQEKMCSAQIKPEDDPIGPGIWNLADDVLVNVLTILGPKDLLSIAATCRHFWSLAISIMPCMKLKLFPHQEAAVKWMLKRERKVEVLEHPLYVGFSTDDGFSFCINVASGEISTGTAPFINDFRGGMFCDEPGLGKTITALSLILKTHGTLADPPPGVDVVWCMHNHDKKCGYYEISSDKISSGNFMSTWKRFTGQKVRRGKASSNRSSLDFALVENSKCFLLKQGCVVDSDHPAGSPLSSCVNSQTLSCTDSRFMTAKHALRRTRNLSYIKRNLLDTFGNNSEDVSHPKLPRSCKKSRKENADCLDYNENWVQCDSCRKWRKISQTLDDATAWFCSMNSDPSYQSCAVPEECWNYEQRITCLPGFYTKGTPQGKEQNVTFFTNVLKEHFTLLNSESRKALIWLANLPQNKLDEMEKVGLRRLLHDTSVDPSQHGYHKIFQAFGLVKRVEKGTILWYYPQRLDNLVFDSTALKIAMTKPLDLFRLYLSRATLIVVPANLVDHWKTQIQKHVSPGQLQIYIWTDNKKPSAHNLAWDYDIVITTFTRLSAEWGPRKRSVLMQIHWLRVMLDEGHTLGSSLSLTNKLQMAISLVASNRWILTGTPTPNTPNNQVAHLQPMLKFLHDEAYGQNQDLWEAGILRPFEAHMEEGRARLLQLLQRTMISARKKDLKSIPPCTKKVTFLNFNEDHAWSYNELVATVRRNILMADWNDPSHVESLLNPKQWKFRGSTIRNVRLSCCVAGHIKVTDAGQDIQETMDMLVQQGLHPLSEEYSHIRISLLNGCSCSRCEDWCRLPIITPCRHLLCLGCVSLDSEKCTFPGCQNHYEMQSPEILTRPENPNPKWPVPKDLIELQPSYKQDDWDPDWQSTSSSKVAYLLGRLKDLYESNRKIDYCVSGLDNCKVLETSQKNHSCIPTIQGVSMKRYGEYSCLLPDKVIIFSQFLEHIHVIEQQLTVAGIKYAGMYSPLHSDKKMKALAIFQNDPSCLALLMDGSAALGLDLSFVTYVFLMEPIWDRSMEEQVISRAHRMGAVRPISVETLVMHGTIEEQMVAFLQDIDLCQRALKQEFSKADGGVTRPHRTLHDFAESNYLAQLSFVRTNAK
ncbi:LOW QUALITY PROTEIN: F-box protein At3g54460 [Dioscorea cayenensis subsp. rotundata]|uniref:LOW QUALITY PROTEIN: F-box protein At3g54460 n=1 Tax=Dioscorea cayennensis subsp. rotundata TaxID=55577 RepID=A0AB40BN16_DIOCR|nr:LOW QUALITY PROTEIN: F-box protein At3g54460 [Dioscorea cayenensis subsp. rotundata]